MKMKELNGNGGVDSRALKVESSKTGENPLEFGAPRRGVSGGAQARLGRRRDGDLRRWAWVNKSATFMADPSTFLGKP